MKKRTKQIVLWILLILLFATMITPIFMLTQLKLGMSHDIAIKKDSTWVFSIHPTEVLNSEGQPATLASPLDPALINWTNTNEAVASVDFDPETQHFTITSKANGTAVFVGSDGLNASLRLEVNVLDGIAYETKPQVIDINQPLKLEVVTQPLADILSFKPSFRSSNPEIVSVSQEGVAKGVSVGKANIIAHYLGYETSLELEVQDLPDFTFELDRVEMNMQSSVQIPYQVSIYDEAIDPTITWSSSNTNIVEVNQEGLITAFNRGTATVSASVNNKQYDLLVQVKSNVVDFVIDEKELVLNKGDQHTLKVTFNPEIYDNYPITWVSSKPSIAQVVNGVVTAVGAGKTTISAQVDKLKREVEVSVEVPLESITVSPSNAKIYEGQGVQLNPLYYPTDTTTKKEPVFSSSNPAVARVDEKGFVIGQGVGSAMIFVSNAGFQYSVPIQVQNKIDEEGNQVVTGVYRDGTVRFDGVSFQMDRAFVLEIGMEPQFVNTTLVDLEVVLPDNFFENHKAKFEKIILNSGYIGKEIVLTIRKSTEPVLKYHFDNYDLAEANLWMDFLKGNSAFGNANKDQITFTMPIAFDDAHQLRFYVGTEMANQSISGYKKQDGEYVLVTKDIVVDPSGFVSLGHFQAGDEVGLEVNRLSKPFYTTWYFVLGATLAVVLGLTLFITGFRLRKPKSKLNEEEQV